MSKRSRERNATWQNVDALLARRARQEIDELDRMGLYGNKVWPVRHHESGRTASRRGLEEAKV